MSANSQFQQGVLEGRVLFYGLLILVITIIVYFVVKGMKKSKGRDEEFHAENPDDLWECPECGEKNINTSFQCGKCSYKIT